jgi:hypothetical protein
MPEPGLSAHTRVARRPGVIFERVLDETVVLDLDSDAYWRLNPSGRWLWEQLSAPRTIGELSDVLGARFELDGTRALADVTEFVSDLAERGLVELAD